MTEESRKFLRYVAAECQDPAPAKPHPMFVEGYEAGFADALNDAAADLMAAACRVVDAYKLTAEFSTPRDILALRAALNACKQRAA